MCRFAAYVGPPRALSCLLYDGSHSLETQAYEPREMLRAKVNVDGTGVAWWRDDGAEPPLRYVTTATPWADANLPTLSRRLRGRLQIAAVRSATAGIPFGAANVAPFVHGDVAFAHNGELSGFRDGIGRELTRRLPDRLYAALETASDSVVVFLTLLRHLDEGGGDLAAATAAALREVATVVVDAGEQATLNLLVADGADVVATRVSVGWPGNSLYVLEDAGEWRGAVVVASEALDDDPAWRPVDDGTLLCVRAGRVERRPLTLP